MQIIRLIYRIASKVYRFLGYKESFSLDGEDSILNKYLLGFEKGNYIDIGSHKPVSFSNTFLLYLKGWKGICLDPLPSLKRKYKIFRPNDLFINSGILNKMDNNKLNYYFYKNHPDCSTFDNNRVEKLKREFNRLPTSVLEISTISPKELIKVSNNFFKGFNEIHLLNIDTEGFEYLICKEFFLEKKFPWIICVEELGYNVENIVLSKVFKLMKENGYILGSRTFLSSIYLKKDKLSELPSPYLKELI